MIRTLRIVLALGLLAALFWIVDFDQLIQAFSHLTWYYIAALLGLSAALIWVSCVKWQLFVRATGHQATVLSLMNYYTMSYFFNMFLPSSLGGDVARSVQLGRELGSQKSAFASMIVERYTGFLAMTLIGALFVALGSQTTEGVEIAILFISGVTIIVGLVCFSETLARLAIQIALRLSRMLAPARITELLETFAEKVLTATAFARNNSPLFFKAMILSFMFHFLAVVNTYICALAVGWYDVSFGALCIVVPLVLLVAVAAITPMSIGITEGAFLFLLMRVGATEAQGLGVALILRAKNVITALVGGLLWLAWNTSALRRVRPETCSKVRNASKGAAQ